jgi:hypothetical protein
MVIDLSAGSYCQCGEEAIVTVGTDHIPLCVIHLDQWLRTAFPKEDHEADT